MLLVDREDGAGEKTKLPVLVESGTKHKFVLSFKNAAGAKKFLKESDTEDGVPMMVVKGNAMTMIETARTLGADGILIDYDASTQRYGGASLLPQV